MIYMQLKFVNSSEIGRPKGRARFRNPIITGKLYQYREPQFDVAFWAPATLLAKQTLFKIAQGQTYNFPGGGSIVKTLWHTSMAKSGEFPQPDIFYAKQISVDWRNDIFELDAQHLAWDTLVTFNISGRPFLQIAATKLPCAGGVYGFTGTNFSNGIPTQDNEFDFSGENGETILQGQTFDVTVDPALVSDSTGAGVYTSQSDQEDAGGTGIQAKVTLDGLYGRTVL